VPKSFLRTAVRLGAIAPFAVKLSRNKYRGLLARSPLGSLRNAPGVLFKTRQKKVFLISRTPVPSPYAPLGLLKTRTKRLSFKLVVRHSPVRQYPRKKYLFQRKTFMLSCLTRPAARHRKNPVLLL
jgi:hypothetical protein